MLVKFFDKIFLKFIIVGIINTFFGSMLSYYLNKKFTFKNKGTGLRTIFKFIINIFICYFMAYGIAKPLITLLLVNYNKIIQENVAMFIGMVLFVILNYLGQRFFVFKEIEEN